jgi:arylsulfatase A-like enzyme
MISDAPSSAPLPRPPRLPPLPNQVKPESRFPLRVLSFLFIAFLTLPIPHDAAAQPHLDGTTRSNVVFFLVDDLGVMDIGAYNPDTFYETPNIDRLAAEGMLFTHGYAANPVCSPSRYALMTGKHPSRPNSTNFFGGSRQGRFRPALVHAQMDLEEITLAEAFKEAGYATCFAGKWHLGPTEEFWPENQGFDVNIGGHSKGSPPGGYFAPYTNPRLESGPEGEHLPERLTREVNQFIEENHENPFFVYLSFYSVHTPLQGRPDLIEKYEQKAAQLSGIDEEPEFGPEEQVWPKETVTVRQGKKRVQQTGQRLVRLRQQHPTYAAMMESMDTAVGAVLDKLTVLGLDENTIICFTSDNGGLSTSEGSPTSNLPLRGGKGWLYEGGIREPFLIKAPGITQPGTVSNEPVVGMDFYPTLLNLTGLNLNPQQHLDGVSLVPLLKNPASTLERDALFWHYPHYSNQGGFPGAVVRMGDYKLVERFEDGRVHLYNTADDLGEQNDLAESMPEKVAAMRNTLHAWYRKVDAKFLQPPASGSPPAWRPGQ